MKRILVTEKSICEFSLRENSYVFNSEFSVLCIVPNGKCGVKNLGKLLLQGFQVLWFDESCRELKNQNFKLLKLFCETRNSYFYDNFKRARNAFKQLVRNKSREHKEMQKAEIEKAYDDQKHFWTLIKSTLREISVRTPSPQNNGMTTIKSY